jgi:hypothetical protein
MCIIVQDILMATNQRWRKDLKVQHRQYPERPQVNMKIGHFGCVVCSWIRKQTYGLTQFVRKYDKKALPSETVNTKCVFIGISCYNALRPLRLSFGKNDEGRGRAYPKPTLEGLNYWPRFKLGTSTIRNMNHTATSVPKFIKELDYTL